MHKLANKTKLESLASDRSQSLSLTPRQYLCRWSFIVERCRHKRVLHLGCIGMTDRPLADKLQAMRDNQVLHPLLEKVAASVVGVDSEVEAVEELNRNGLHEIIAGDVRNIDRLYLGRDFDVVVCGDLIEHLDEPGRMLSGIRTCMAPRAELLITTPNSLGLPNFVRYALGRPIDGTEHLISFNIFTLNNLLRRHGFRIQESYSCYDRPVTTMLGRALLFVGVPIFRLAPRFGGTLGVVARLACKH